MITGYEVHSINNENVLFLYLNYDSEFGMDFRFHHKNSNMKQEIKKFMKEKNIKFNGEKIALSFGGIVLAVLLLVENPTTTTDDIKLTYVSDHIIPEETVEVVTHSDSMGEILEDTGHNTVIDTNQQENSNNKQNINANTNTNTNVNASINTNNNSNSTSTNAISDTNKPSNENTIAQNNSTSTNLNSNTPTSSTDNSTNTTQQDKVTQTTISEKQVTIYRTNGSVITLSLEEYLIGVVGAEMPASFSIEALKSQAVVARTYALKKLESGGKLTDSVSTQSYKDNNELKQLWGSSYNTYYQKVKSAVESTKGLAIYYQGGLIDAVYHSTSNGYTEDSIYVWGNSVPYLKSVDSSWDKEASSYLREVSKDFSNVLQLLGIDIKEDVSFEILSRDNSGRVLEVRVGNQTFSGVEFRTLLGLRSADFDLNLENGTLNITTRGYGHGVGMSQYGANGMAKQGYTYEQILKHYYTGVNIY